MKKADAYELRARIDELRLSYFDRAVSIKEHVDEADRAASYAGLEDEIDAYILCATARHDDREVEALAAAKSYLRALI